ncbi:MAG: aldehyde dehydrogenase family protein [Desertimonas sp.]
MTTGRLHRLIAGQPIPYGGDRVTHVDERLATDFVDGDRLVVVQDTGDLLHIPADAHDAAAAAVTSATASFAGLAGVDDDAISAFFDDFAGRLDDDATLAPVLAANDADVARAAAAGRSTTRLVLTPGMRADMASGLRGWARSPLRRDGPLGEHVHDGWRVTARRAPLGVVGFVFEGRPNVFADAAGVVRTGNTVVMRIGSDALGTADALVAAALDPALAAAGLPAGTISLVASPARAAGWALFSDRRLALAVARGSGRAVAQLGAVARQSGVPVSLHGTGGAWIVAGDSAGADRLHAAIVNSLDRKVCNTLNVCCLPAGRADLVPVVLDAVREAGRRRGTASRIHVERSSRPAFPDEIFRAEVDVVRADGIHVEPFASPIEADELGHEWEWEASPELSVVVVPTLDDAVALFNRHSPRFVATLIGDDAEQFERFYAAVDAPFVGDGFTRWVDGQYALSTPELGLSNWQGGRLLGRGAILSGDSVHTVRHRASIEADDLHR